MDAWARANLTRGDSAGQIWEISAEYPEARLTLGSAPDAGWAIRAHGVHPIHCELFWDGRALWVADTAQVGGVFLDGQRVGDWIQIHGPAQLRFGQASMDVETSAPMGQRMMSNPVHAKPITLTDLALPEPKNAHFGGAAGDRELSVPDLEGEKTKLAAAPSAAQIQARMGGGGAAPVLRPRLGGAVAGATPPAADHNAEATRMVAMPVRPEEPAAPAFQIPGAATGGFAPPPASSAPPVEKEHAVGKFLGTLKIKLKPEPPPPKGEPALPLRTWILLGVTVLVTVGWLLWDDAPEPEASAEAPAATSAELDAGEDPAVENPVAVVENPDIENPDIENAAEIPIPTPSSEPLPASEGNAEGEEGPSRVRRAADAYIAGRYADALVAYEELAAAYPDDPAYAAMVRILERRASREEN